LFSISFFRDFKEGKETEVDFKQIGGTADVIYLRLSSPPTLVVEGVNSSPNWRIVAYEIGDKFNRSSSFDSKSVTIGL
ncbi:unnamed protein product, partial [Arabidopsis halleri]